MKRIMNDAYSVISDLFEKTVKKIRANPKKLLVYSFLVGICGLILKLFDLITLFYIGLILISGSILIYFKLIEVHKVGAINYLPRPLKNAMLRRSIFDILMDIWYLPTLSQYIKLFVKPFFSKITPEEATKLLEDFSSGQRKIFLTKGIVNIFPEKVKYALLPICNKGQEVIESNAKNNMIEENHSDSTRSDIALNERNENSNTVMLHNIINNNNNTSNEINQSHGENENSNQKIIKNTKKDRMIVPFSLDKSGKILLAPIIGNKYKLHKRRPFSRMLYKKPLSSSLINSKYEFLVERKKSLESHNDNRNEEINIETNLNQPLSNEGQEIELPLINDHSELMYPLKIPQENKIIKHETQSNLNKNNIQEDYRFYEIDDDTGRKKVYRTVVLESSEKMKKKNIERSASSESLKDLKEFCWDNLGKYYHQESKKAMRGNNSKSNFIQIFIKSLRQQIISKIDYNKLSKAFVFFCLTFLMQIIISKKARRWSISLIQFLIYMITSLGAGGTLYFLLTKKKK